jgi:hypothetical protein
MRNAECGLRISFPQWPLSSSVLKTLAAICKSWRRLEFRIPRSAFRIESPTRFHNSGDLPLQGKIAKSNSRYTKLSQVPAGSA